MQLTPRQVKLCRAAIFYAVDITPEAQYDALREAFADPASRPLVTRAALAAWRDRLRADADELDTITVSEEVTTNNGS